MQHKEDLAFVDEHKIHLYPPLEALMNSIIKYDGQRYDLRVNFVGLADGVRLRRDLTMSVKSLPTLTWKERIYEFLVDLFAKMNTTFDDDGINVGNILAEVDLQRPLSLKLCRRATPKGMKIITDADMLREILDQDKRFVMRFNLQKEIHEKRAEAKAMEYNRDGEWVIRSQEDCADFPQASFPNEYAVPLASDPIYVLRYAAVNAPKPTLRKGKRLAGQAVWRMRLGCAVAARLYTRRIFTESLEIA